MYLCYDEAVKTILNTYRKFEYAKSCRSAFRVAAREFKKYMEDIKLPYCPELAQQWIDVNTEHWNRSKLNSSKKDPKGNFSFPIGILGTGSLLSNRVLTSLSMEVSSSILMK